MHICHEEIAAVLWFFSISGFFLFWIRAKFWSVCAKLGLRKSKPEHKHSGACAHSSKGTV